MRKISVTIQIDRIKEMKNFARNFKRDWDAGGNMSGVRFSIVAEIIIMQVLVLEPLIPSGNS